MPSNTEIMDLAREIQEEARKQLNKEFGGMGFTSGSNRGEWEAYFERIPGIFQYFTEREPEDVDPIITGLGATANTLGTAVTGRVDTVKTDLHDWTGTGADGFNLYYLSGFDAARVNQIAVVSELVLAVQALRKIIDSSRQDVVTIGNQTLEALKKLDDDDGGGMGKGIMTVCAAVGAALAIAAAGLTGGGSLGIWLAVAGGVVSVGSTTASEVMEVSVQGDSVATVLTSMNDAVRTLLGAIEEQEDVVGRGLKQDITDIDKAMASGSLVAPRVAFIDSPDPAVFHPGPEAS